MALLSLQHITKTYDPTGEPVHALQDISLDIYEHEFLVIMGPSGSGKSSLMNILAGLDRPTSGIFRYKDTDMQKASTSLLALYRQHIVGIVFQSFNLISTLSTKDNITLPRLLSGNKKKDIAQDVSHVLSELGIADKKHVPPNKLSGGQQQRVTIARALINNPDIILADEPTGNLDTKNGETIISILHQINKEQGKTVVIITHNPEIATDADRIVYMKDGMIERIEDKANIPHGEEPGTLQGKPGNLDLKSLFSISLANLLRTKGRTFLTSFGVSIGIAALVLLVSFASALENTVVNSFTSVVGLKQIEVSSKSQSGGFSFSTSNTSQTSSLPLTPQSLSAMKHIAHVSSAYVLDTYLGTITYNKTQATMVAQNAAPIANTNQTNEGVKYGKLFSSDNEKGIILTSSTAKALGFKNAQNMLGKQVKLNLSILSITPTANQAPFSETLTVVGISSQSGLSASSLLPYDLYMQAGNNIQYGNLVVNADSTDHVNDIKTAIENLGYNATSAQDIIDQIQKIFLVVKAIFGVIGGIGLVVACLGIINVMLISVLERFKEIGIMKAVGARPSDIRRLFIVEGATIGIIGGVIGIILGTIVGVLVDIIGNAFIANNGGAKSSLFALSPGIVIIALIIAVGISTLASVYPSARAAALNPIEALRRE